MGGEGASFALPKLGWRAVLAGVLAAVVLGVVIVARLGAGGGDVPGPATGQRQPTTAASPSATPPGSASPSPDDGAVGAAASPYGQPPAAGAIKAAVAFVQAWANHPAGVTAEKWWAAVSRHADPTLSKQLEFTDPERVPATRVTGTAEGIAGGVSSATIAVPTDAGRVVLTCVLVKDRWLVSDVDIERPQP